VALLSVVLFNRLLRCVIAECDARYSVADDDDDAAAADIAAMRFPGHPVIFNSVAM